MQFLSSPGTINSLCECVPTPLLASLLLMVEGSMCALNEANVTWRLPLADADLTNEHRSLAQGLLCSLTMVSSPSARSELYIKPEAFRVTRGLYKALLRHERCF